MRFTVSDEFDAGVDEVERAVLDPEFQKRLVRLPNVSQRSVVSQETSEDGRIHRTVFYKFGGTLPSAARTFLGTTELTWDEVAIFDPSTHEWEFEVKPYAMADRIECRGLQTYTDHGDGSRRDADLELKVKMLLVGGAVENAIRGGLEQTLHAEAQMLREFLAQ